MLYARVACCVVPELAASVAAACSSCATLCRASSAANSRVCWSRARASVTFAPATLFSPRMRPPVKIGIVAPSVTDQLFTHELQAGMVWLGNATCAYDDDNDTFGRYSDLAIRRWARCTFTASDSC